MNLQDRLGRWKALNPQPPELDFAIAACNDRLLDWGWQPCPRSTWLRVFKNAEPSAEELEILRGRQYQPPFAASHLGWLALLAQEMDLFIEVDKASPEARQRPAADLMLEFLLRVRGIPPNLLATSAFRQEEFLRHWAFIFGIPIAGETRADSLQSLRTCDYLRALCESAEAEKVLQNELAERQRIIARLQEQAAANRSSYE